MHTLCALAHVVGWCALVILPVMDAAAWADTVWVPYRGEPVTPMTERWWR